MPNFEMLSLNDNDMPKNKGDNELLNSKSMEDLFINIYSYENPNISFEDLRQKLIDYYFEEATDEYISKHLTIIIELCDPKIISNIQEIVVYNHYQENYNLYMIIHFISSSYGTDYLHHIYHIFISP